MAQKVQKKHKTYCQICEKEKENKFCKNCDKKTPNLIRIDLTETIKMHDSLSLIHKRTGFKKFLRKVFSGWKPSGDPRLSEGVNIEMVVDRENNKYDQVVKDAKTDEVLHGEHELLTEHKNAI